MTGFYWLVHIEWHHSGLWSVLFVAGEAGRASGAHGWVRVPKRWVWSVRADRHVPRPLHPPESNTMFGKETASTAHKGDKVMFWQSIKKKTHTHTSKTKTNRSIKSVLYSRRGRKQVRPTTVQSAWPRSSAKLWRASYDKAYLSIWNLFCQIVSTAFSTVTQLSLSY
jgi:hypothetical protein